MRFLIIGVSNSKNTKDLEIEILQRGDEVVTVEPKNFVFSVDESGFGATADGHNLFDFDVYLLRAYNISVNEMRIFTESLLKKGKTVVDEVVGGDYIPSKLFEASRLSRAGLKYPKTFCVLNDESFEQIKDKISFPLVVKPVDGQKGQGVEKIETEGALKNFLKEHSRGWLIQEFLRIDGDVRVFVVGEKVLGAIKRSVMQDDFRSNASLGADAKKYDLTQEMVEIARKAKEAMNCEVAGVDLAFHEGEWYVIEVNFTPQWQKFKEVTGINPAKYIVDYAVKKHS